MQKKPYLFFRIDSDPKMGSGHLIRAWVLADYLKKNFNYHPFFICQDNAATRTFFNKKQAEVFFFKDGFKGKRELNWFLKSVPKFQPKGLIFDLHHFNYPQRRTLFPQLRRRYPIPIVFFDNHWKSRNGASLTVNPLPYPKEKRKKNGRQLDGLNYFVLHPQYKPFLSKKKKILKKVKKVVISMGSSNLNHLTSHALQALKLAKEKFHVDVVIGPLFHPKEIAAIKQMATGHEVRVIEKEWNLAPILADADLAILSVGLTTYEAAALGVPIAVLSPTPYHGKIARLLKKMGMIEHLGVVGAIAHKRICQKIEKLICDQKKRNKLSRKGKELVNSKGVERCAKAIDQVCCHAASL